MAQPSWTTHLHSDPVSWLLGQDNPSVRFLTLRDILDKPETDPDVAQAKADIMTLGPVPEILAKQNKDGSWADPQAFYTAKYEGAVWQLLILSELHADPVDPRVHKACEFIITNAQDRESGAFAMHTSAKNGGGRHSEVIPCLTGNMVWSLLALGSNKTDEIQRGIDWIVQFQRFDDGDGQVPKIWPYDRYPTCWSSHTCHMGVVKSLKALAAIPEGNRSPEIKTTIGKAVEYLLIHHVYKKSHDLTQISKPGWLRFGFPLMYQTDVLEILCILTALGVRDDRMQEAVDLVVDQQDSTGRWMMDNSFNDRFLTSIEKKNEPSKWITLRALTVLKKYYS